MNDFQDHSPSISTDFSEREKMEMLENWFQRRAEMTSKALRLILIPVIAVLFFTAAFYSLYIIEPPVIVAIVFLGLIGISLLAWLICLFIGGRIFKRVRTGDSIMLRKIRSSESSPQS